MASLFVLSTLSSSLLCPIICQANLISEVCSKSTNPSLCIQTIGSDPRALRADLRGLGQIVVENAKAAINNVIIIVKSIGGEITDTCVETSGDAIDNLNECSVYLKKSDRMSINDLQTKGSAALTDVGTCDDEFGNHEPANLKAATGKAQDFIDILLVIANQL